MSNFPRQLRKEGRLNTRSKSNQWGVKDLTQNFVGFNFLVGSQHTNHVVELHFLGNLCLVVFVEPGEVNYWWYLHIFICNGKNIKMVYSKSYIQMHAYNIAEIAAIVFHNVILLQQTSSGEQQGMDQTFSFQLHWMPLVTNKKDATEIARCKR